MKSYKTTADIDVPVKIIDQIIGQEKAVSIVRKAARQRRNILLIGTPGTGKSMLAQGMAELMPTEELEDILVYPNSIDENNPDVRVFKTYPPQDNENKTKQEPEAAGKNGERLGQGRRILDMARRKSRMNVGGKNNAPLYIMMIIAIALVALSFSGAIGENLTWVIAAAILGLFLLSSSWIFSSQLARRGGADLSEPKLIVDNSGKQNAPFIDATGSKAGALFGDVKHDPLQSFLSDSVLYEVEDNRGMKTTFASAWEKMRLKYPELVKKQGDYEYVELPEQEELYVLTADGDSLAATRVMSMNRRPYSGKIISLETGSSKITATPEHKIMCGNGEREISSISEGDEVFTV